MEDHQDHLGLQAHPEEDHQEEDHQDHLMEAIHTTDLILFQEEDHQAEDHLQAHRQGELLPLLKANTLKELSKLDLTGSSTFGKLILM
jgi:hypothetical protein